LSISLRDNMRPLLKFIFLLVQILIGTATHTQESCSYHKRNFINSYMKMLNQIRVENYVDEFESASGRFSLRTSELLQNVIIRHHMTSNHVVSITKYKQRVTAIIEFMEVGEPGYVKGEDLIVQRWDLNSSNLSWSLPNLGNGYADFFAYVAQKNHIVLSVHGQVNFTQDPCLQYPFVPSPTSIWLTVDFAPLYFKTDSKIALEILYSHHEEKYQNNDIVPKEELLQEFHPRGLPTTIQTLFGLQNVSSIFKSSKSQLELYLGLDSTNHIPFTIPLVVSK